MTVIMLLKQQRKAFIETSLFSRTRCRAGKHRAAKRGQATSVPISLCTNWNSYRWRDSELEKSHLWRRLPTDSRHCVDGLRRSKRRNAFSAIFFCLLLLIRQLIIGCVCLSAQQRIDRKFENNAES